MSERASYVVEILARLSQVITSEDDPRLWRAVVALLLDDVDTVLASSRSKDEVLLEIGCCSHWLRPHQTRWTAAGGFAWPAGYGTGEGHGRHGLPVLEGSRTFHRDRITGAWVSAHGRPGRRPLLLRVAVPTRSARHPQAAVHTLWTPGSPLRPDQKAERFLGFSLDQPGWKLVADSSPLWDSDSAA